MPEYLEMTADKFTFRVATDRFYTPAGVWVKPEEKSKRVRLGVADYPQQHNGDVAFVQVKPVGTSLEVGGEFAEIETIKALVELQAPVSGTIVEVNGALDADPGPEAINQSCYESGWLAVMETRAWEAERSRLLDAASYFAVMEAQVEQELKGS